MAFLQYIRSAQFNHKKFFWTLILKPYSLQLQLIMSFSGWECSTLIPMYLLANFIYDFWIWFLKSLKKTCQFVCWSILGCVYVCVRVYFWDLKNSLREYNNILPLHFSPSTPTLSIPFTTSCVVLNMIH